jgi:DNA-binding transcriptional regulator LsrR (DeoR family)
MNSEYISAPFMHYETGMSQQEIADKLGLSMMSVSRMLQKAKDLGVGLSDGSILGMGVGSTIGQIVQLMGGLTDVTFENPLSITRQWAGGEFKAQAIKGALRSGIITVLVTDEKTASFIVDAL